MSPQVRGDLFAKIVGFFVMMVGLAVILGVLWLAFGMFKDPNMGLGAGAASKTATELGAGIVRLVFRLALLFLGSISGSLIANKGIHLYFTGAAHGSGPTTVINATPAHAPAPEPSLPPTTHVEKAAKRS